VVNMSYSIKNKVYSLILPELKMILQWSENIEGKENFNVDELYATITREYGKDLKVPFINEIYSLTDVLCDSLRHSNPKINDRYSVEEALSDLKEIVMIFENNVTDEFEKETLLKKRLSPDNLYK